MATRVSVVKNPITMARPAIDSEHGETDPDTRRPADVPHRAGQLRVFLVELALDFGQDLLFVIVERHRFLRSSS